MSTYAFCTNCGKEAAPGSLFCAGCGWTLTKPGQAVPPVVAAPAVVAVMTPPPSPPVAPPSPPAVPPVPPSLPPQTAPTPPVGPPSSDLGFTSNPSKSTKAPWIVTGLVGVILIAALVGLVASGSHPSSNAANTTAPTTVTPATKSPATIKNLANSPAGKACSSLATDMQQSASERVGLETATTFANAANAASNSDPTTAGQLSHDAGAFLLMFTNNPAGAANVNLYPTAEVVADCAVFGVTVPLISNDTAPSAAPTTAVPPTSSSSPVKATSPSVPSAPTPTAVTNTYQPTGSGYSPPAFVTPTTTQSSLQQVIAAAEQAFVSDVMTAIPTSAGRIDGQFGKNLGEIGLSAVNNNFTYSEQVTNLINAYGFTQAVPPSFTGTYWLSNADAQTFITLAIKDIRSVIPGY